MLLIFKRHCADPQRPLLLEGACRGAREAPTGSSMHHALVVAHHGLAWETLDHLKTLGPMLSPQHVVLAGRRAASSPGWSSALHACSRPVRHTDVASAWARRCPVGACKPGFASLTKRSYKAQDIVQILPRPHRCICTQHAGDHTALPPKLAVGLQQGRQGEWRRDHSSPGAQLMSSM